MKTRILFLLLLTVFGGYPAVVQAESLEVAQQRADETCRQANRMLDIFSRPSVDQDSETLATLNPGTKLRIVNTGEGGWVAVEAPRRGFVIARYLTTCSATVVTPPQSQPQPRPQTPATPTTTAQPSAPVTLSRPGSPLPATAGSCRQALLGLSVRSRPDGTLGAISGVQQGQRVTLTGESFTDSEGRIWLQISSPQSGWISGGRGGWMNVIPCP
ncbi:SH3 domain-containing protein [Spirulina subsalsa FACHB-351]|uniref:SH3 domain-containing protein n=1 Tax=Spirulina subsalsa FACHB-351 TaxID=234711 RepID=A0ABT3L9K2_9CYAN|nr:SH3 domain-containing protein [Spirulina subsalsa]MCW6038147.1 SH3 domain-containing protein [Spirulina subsalsa FACHB-351]